MRDLFDQGLKEATAAGSRELTANGLYRALAKCVRGSEGLSMPDWAEENLSVQHHSGFLPFLQRMGVIQKAPAADQRRGSAEILTLGETAGLYKLQGFSGDLRDLLGGMVALGPQLTVLLWRPPGSQGGSSSLAHSPGFSQALGSFPCNHLLTQPRPRTALDWAEAATSLQYLLRKCRLFKGGGDSYNCLWAVRTVLVSQP